MWLRTSPGRHGTRTHTLRLPNKPPKWHAKTQRNSCYAEPGMAKRTRAAACEHKWSPAHWALASPTTPEGFCCWRLL